MEIALIIITSLSLLGMLILAVLVFTLRDELARNRTETQQRDTALRQELNEASIQTRSELRQQLSDFANHLESLRTTLERRLTELQMGNESKLEAMRQTVDEKLQTTLERRLGESFKQVSERLEWVHRGLGEMQQIAVGVGDLKKVLTNIKTRGTWGEMQLSALLEQVLSPEQYAANVAPKPQSAERVEFALKLPGQAADEAPVWLPIDAKFPVEDYQRLLTAMDTGNAPAAESAAKALEIRLRQQARDIRDKYLSPPHTTDFGILFLPSEGLYAEALRRPGLAETLQNESRVIIAGPTTLAALLNSLQVGFRTLAIQERSSEVWKVLGAVKTEFSRFGDVLEKVKDKLEQASKQIEETQHRSRQIHKRLHRVEALPLTQPSTD